MWIAGQPALRQRGDGVGCAVSLVDRPGLVGCVGLKKTDWHSRVTEVGYWAVPEHRDHGYITAATRAISRWALGETGMARVELLAAPENAASNRVAIGADYQLEGLKRNAGFIHSGPTDLNLYALTFADLPAA